VAQGVGSEFKPQYHKKKKKDELCHTLLSGRAQPNYLQGPYLELPCQLIIAFPSVYFIFLDKVIMVHACFCVLIFSLVNNRGDASPI
jgi:hypothetical protein